MATIINIENNVGNGVISVTTDNGVVFTEDEFIEEIFEGVFTSIHIMNELFGEEAVTEMLDKLKEKYKDNYGELKLKFGEIFEKLISCAEES